MPLFNYCIVTSVFGPVLVMTLQLFEYENQTWLSLQWFEHEKQDALLLVYVFVELRIVAANDS